MQKILEKIYRENKQGLFTLALSITRCTLSAEDAIHDAFAKLLVSDRKIPKSSAAAYVFSSVKNSAIDILRKRKLAQLPEQATTIFDSGEKSPIGKMLDWEHQSFLETKLNQLKPEQMQIVVLKIFAQLTFEQIGQIVDLPVQTVASRYRRAIEKLRKECEQWT